MKVNQSYFDGHWRDSPKEGFPEGKVLRAKNFLSPIHERLIRNISILDCGCGDGVHAHYIHEINPNVDYHGIDISLECLKLAKSHVPTFNFKEGNVGNLDYENDSFDLTISYGVIAYTEDPIQSINELVRVTKPNGTIGIWCCTFDNIIIKTTLLLLRLICKYSSRHITNLIANSLVPLLYIIKNDSGINLSNSTWYQCKEVSLVNIAPPILNLYSTKQLRIIVNNIDNIVIKRDQCENGNIWAIKKY
jgi:ubiquinone/menaquinone biosynthesis C-methylase UbiE